MCSHSLLEFTYNFGGLMQRRRSSMVKTLKSCLFYIFSYMHKSMCQDKYLQ